jgi:hypothetical protein
MQGKNALSKKFLRADTEGKGPLAGRARLRLGALCYTARFVYSTHSVEGHSE